MIFLIFKFNILCLMSYEVLSCNSGFFGPNCDQVCHCLSGNLVCNTINGNCADNLCAIGYKSPPKCQKECDNNTFGLECSEQCHCLPKDVCFHVNGHCSLNECALGWGGAACQRKLPMLYAPLKIETNLNGSIVSWSHYKPGVTGSGNDLIKAYILQCRESGRNDWMDVYSVLNNDHVDEFSVNLSKSNFMWLRNLVIKCRILLSYVVGSKTKNTNYALASKLFRISCTQPLIPDDLNIIYTNKFEIIKIVWKLKENKTSNCRFFKYYEINFILEYSNPVNIQLRVNIEHPFNYTIVKLNLKRHYKVSIMLRSFNDADLASNFTNITNLNFFESHSPPQQDFSEFQVANEYFSDIINGHENNIHSNYVLLQEMNLIGRNQTCLMIEVADSSVCDLKLSNTKARIKLANKNNQPIINASYSNTVSSSNQLNICDLKQANIYNVIIDCSHILKHVMFLTASTGFQVPTVRINAFMTIQNNSFDVELYIDIERSAINADNIKESILVIVEETFNDFRTSFLDELFDEDRILIEDSRLVGQKYLHDIETSKSLDLAFYIAANITKSNFRQKRMIINQTTYSHILQANKFKRSHNEFKIILGDDKTYGEYRNAPLKENGNYIIYIAHQSTLDDRSIYQFSEPVTITTPLLLSRTGQESYIWILLYILIILLILIPAILVTVFLCKHLYHLICRKPFRCEENGIAYIYDMHAMKSSKSAMLSKPSMLMKNLFQTKVCSPTQCIIPEPTILHGPSVSQLYKIKYIPENMISDACNYLFANNDQYLKCEFDLIPNYQTDFTHTASILVNRVHNRDQNVIPYDRNIISIGEFISTQYINASEVKALNNLNFVVTQWPTLMSFKIFWQMVWEQFIGNIVALADHNLNESLYIYWPQSTQSQKNAGFICVKLQSEKVFANYSMRKFMIWNKQCTDEVRTIYFWQYTSWKDEINNFNSLPKHPVPFVSFAHCSMEANTGKNLVHCIDGGNRSGLYVALISLLKQGRSVGFVNPLKMATLLRSERCGVLTSINYYRFLYICLLEEFSHNISRFSVDTFIRNFENINTKMNLKNSIALDHKELLKSNNHLFKKNQMDEDCLITLDGFLQSNSFIIFQHGSNMCHDMFWLYTMERAACCIVLLSLLEDANFIPKVYASYHDTNCTVECITKAIHPQDACNFYNIIVHRCKSRTFSKYSQLNGNQSSVFRRKDNSCGDNSMLKMEKANRVEEFALTENGGDNLREELSLRMFEFSHWSYSNSVPTSVELFAEYVVQVHLWKNKFREYRPIMVVSSSSESERRCAIFTTAMYIYEQILNEKIVDVFAACHYTTDHFPGFLLALEEYLFLHCLIKFFSTRFNGQLDIYHNSNDVENTRNYPDEEITKNGENLENINDVAFENNKSDHKNFNLNLLKGIKNFCHKSTNNSPYKIKVDRDKSLNCIDEKYVAEKDVSSSKGPNFSENNDHGLKRYKDQEHDDNFVFQNNSKVCSKSCERSKDDAFVMDYELSMIGCNN